MKKVICSRSTTFLVKNEWYVVEDETPDMYLILVSVKSSIWYPKNYFKEVNPQ